MRFNWILLIILLLGASALVAMNMVSSGNVTALYYVLGGIVVLCVLLLLVFYRSILKPIRTISNGVNLLREQDFSSRLAPVGQREADRIVEMFNRMMTSLKDERLRVREQNHFLDLLIEVSPMGIMIIGQDDRITLVNKAATSYLGYDQAGEITGMRLKEIDGALGRIVADLKRDEVVTVRLDDSMIYRCSRLSFMDKGYVHPFILIEALTEEVMLAERKSYEKVIRVIAHEVNNSMASVYSMLDTMALVSEAEGRDDSESEILRVCEQRCRSLSRFITAYADVVKIPDASPVAVSLNTFVTDISVLLDSMCVNYGVKFSLDLDQDDVTVNVDPVLFEQVLINIVKNSAESASGKGYVSVKTCSQPPSLTVTDNGGGISPEASSKLFSPFFSTKPEGQGIGLLFISDVLRKHRCRFSLRTDDDGLTRFTIRFSH